MFFSLPSFRDARMERNISSLPKSRAMDIWLTAYFLIDLRKFAFRIHAWNELPHLLQKSASDGLGEPHLVQNFPFTNRLSAGKDCAGAGSTAALTSACLASVISSRNALVISWDPFRNSLIDLPAQRPTSGRLFGPKRRRAMITKTTM